MLTTRSHDKDQGQVVILVALMMVILLLFAGFVIDIGQLYLERRQDQTAADAAVMAGASNLVIRPGAPRDQAMADLAAQHAMDVARSNLRQTYSDAEWTALWTACDDPQRNMTQFPAGLRATATDCIHFNVGYTRMRVRLPDQLVPTSFAKVIGINTLSTTAAAEAQISVKLGAGGGLPFAVQNGTGSNQDLICIRLDRNCTPATNQGIKILDSPLHGNMQFGTTRVCGSMRTPTGTSTPQTDATLRTRAANNAAVGMDHDIYVLLPGDNKIVDDCGPASPRANPPATPNWVYATELDGIVSQNPAAAKSFLEGIGDGLVFGTAFSDGGPPRLQRLPAGWAQTRDLVVGTQTYVVDDRPLWDYIRPGATNIPAQCARSSFDPSAWVPSNPNTTGPTSGHMVGCLTAWRNATNPDPLFDMDSNGDGKFDIEEAPRAGFFPITGIPGNQNYPPSPVLGFELGFINTLYMSSSPTSACPAPPDTTCTVYHAGVATTSPDDPIDDPIDLTGKSIVGLSFFRVTELMLPPGARIDPPGDLSDEITLSR